MRDEPGGPIWAKVFGRDGSAIAAILNAFPVGQYSFRDAANEVTSWPGSPYSGGFTRVDQFGQGIILVLSDEELDVARIEWSADGVNPVSGGLLNNPTNLAHIPPSATFPYHIYFARVFSVRLAPYYRIHVEDAGSPSVFETFAGWSGHAFEGAFSTLTAALNQQNHYLLTRSVPAGVEPDGETLTNAPADGVVYEYVDADGLAPAEQVVGPVFDTQGHRTVKLTITTNQVSATDGVKIHWYRDAAGTQPVLPPTKRTFKADDAAEGGAAYIVIPRARYGKPDYTNGGSQQASFVAQVTLHAAALTNPIGEIGGSVSLTSLAVMGLSHLMGANDSDVIDIIRRASGGGLRVAVNQHEVETPIKALSTHQYNQSNVGTSAVQIVGSPLAGRRTVAIKALAGNNAKVYIGKSGVTTGSGFELDSREFIILELDDTAAGLFAIAASGTQRVCWAEVGVA